ncbi:MAG: 30S ribosomal protein S8 [Puniceicoccales bacterium]|jgi:small subunit ribosomal protein S8|nr:30S ribosomal protein S8 [Puniceicoccales bacterium]
MASHDTIGDFLTIIRNGYTAELATVTAQWSKVREGIVRILKENGYISDYTKGDSPAGLPVLAVQLKYNNRVPAIAGIKRVSSPGRRVYTGYTEIPKVIGGMGISILTTSRGLLSDRDARQQKTGGELLAQVW